MTSTSIVYFQIKTLQTHTFSCALFFFSIRYMCTLFLFINIINNPGSHSVLVYKECPHFSLQLKIIYWYAPSFI